MVLEIWKRRGQVEVSRDRRGRFVSWHRIFGEIIGKRVAVYGRARVKGKVSSRRIEFYGSGKDLHHAVALALNYPPRQRFVTVSAKELNRNPFKYCGEGEWVDTPEVES
jgi:hypothetical protein